MYVHVLFHNLFLHEHQPQVFSSLQKPLIKYVLGHAAKNFFQQTREIRFQICEMEKVWSLVGCNADTKHHVS